MSALSSEPSAAEPDDRRYAFRSVSRSHVGRVRRVNEDRVLDDAAAGVWAVVDGMGGHSGGDLAAQQVVDSLRQAMAGPSAVTPRTVRDALLTANDLIHTRNRRLRLDAGATAVAASFAGGLLEITWAGDSRAYRLGAGRVEQLTHDHSLVQELVDAGLLSADDADRHPQANVVTRALGVDAELALDTISVNPAGDRFLLCSDGLSRSLRESDFHPDLSLGELADKLIANAVGRDGTDNISLVLFEAFAAN